MGIAIPQVITSDRASGAQVIDGSLKIDAVSSQYLQRIPGSSGNLKTWTLSFWVKRVKFGGAQCIFMAYNGSSISEDNYATIEFSNDNSFRIGYAFAAYIKTNRLFRDIGWYHIVSVIDTTQSTASDRVRMYVNGVQETSFSATHNPDENEDLAWNKASFIHRLGSEYNQQFSTFNITQVNFIDGQALGPESFGYTDGLTNTWRLKKYEGTFGTNGFYLPLDGSAPIGEDKSGQGNNWTPVNFGGSVSLDNSIVSGARPILNTLPGGTTATPGVFGSKENQFVTVTVASKTGGGNAYFFGGVERDSLASLRGTTVTFNTTDSTNNSHPFKLSSTNADSSGGTEYTDGVAYYINGSVTDGSTYVSSYSSGAASGFRGIKWTVPHNVSTTYYYCTVHNGMGEGGRLTSTTDETKADPYAWKNVLALPLVGASNDASNLVNSGSTTKTATPSGALASSAASNFYNGSFFFDGSNDYIALTDNADFAFGTGDSTVELWVYPNTLVSNDVLYDGRQSTGGTTTGFSIVVNSSGNVQTYTAGGYRCSSTAQLKIGKWSHIAVVRSSGTDTLFMDGIAQADTDTTNGNYTDQKCRIGSDVNGSEAWGGHISDFRLYKGVAKYTSDFVVPATSPDILPDTPSGVSGGSKLTKITDGAVSFDGSGDYLTVADSADFEFDGDFTLECFVYLTSTSSGQQFFAKRANSSSYGPFALYTNSGATVLQFLGSTSGSSWALDLNGSTNYPIPKNKWTHIAAARSGSTAKIFVDGNEAGSGTLSGTLYNNSSALSVGSGAADGNSPINGFISNARIIKGTALYTSNFTPPTAPLTNVTNTKLLCCQSNTPFNTGAEPILNTNSTGITTTSGTRTDTNSSSIVLALPLLNNSSDVHASIKGSGSNNTITANGNAAASSTQSKYYGGSFVFDGTGDYVITAANTSDLVINTGDFTLEAWIWNNQTSAYQGILSDRPDSGGGTSINITNGNKIEYYAGGTVYNTTIDVPQQSWHHVAFTRQGGTMYSFFDGVLLDSRSATGDNGDNAGIWNIGRYYYSRDGYYYKGYVQDARIYNGVAKYTSNFTVTAPSVEPIAAVSPSSLLGVGNAAATNFNPFNTDINTVRGQETGYATWNPLDLDSNASLSNGNLTISSTTNGWNGVRGTTEFPSSGGKWYFEVLYVSGTYFNVGIDVPADGAVGDLSGANSVILYEDNGTVRYNNQGSTGTISTTIDPGMTFGVAVNHDTKSIQFYIDNILTHSATYTTPKVPAVSGYGTWSGDINFGQKPFKFPPPAGFQPLNGANIRPETVIARSDHYVAATIYTGNGTGQSINTGQKPDFVWIKNRTDATSHMLFDSVRGVQKVIYSNAVTQEQPAAISVTAFNRDGFTVSSANEINGNNDNIVAWTWKAGGSKNTFNVDDVGYASAAAAGLDGGSLAVTGASVGTKQGFSIIKFASGSSGNKTLSHGLLETPTFILVKTTGASSDWSVYHKDLGGTVNNYLVLNTTATNATASNIWGAAVPTSSVFGINPGTTCATNQDVIAYLWHDVPGLQKFGKWTNNNSNDGTFTELGFRPAILLLKDIDGGEQWYIIDSKRQTFNIPAPSNNGAAAVRTLQASSGNDEATADNSHPNTTVDFLSNGFKIYSTNTGAGEISFGTRNYIYAAWAEAPVSGLYGAQSNAR